MISQPNLLKTVRSLMWIFGLLPLHIAAGQVFPDFEKLNIANGLSNNTVYCIFQDSRGWVWIGTDDGLNKYDGREFIVYRRNPRDSGSLSASKVFDIAEDKNGDLWIATDGGGVNRYDRKMNRFSRIIPDTMPERIVDASRALAIWVEDTGRIWIGTSNGLYRLDQETQRIIGLHAGEGTNKGLSHSLIQDIYGDSRGRLWIGTADGLNLYDPDNHVFEHLFFFKNNKAEDIRAIYEDAGGNLWLGVYGQGLVRFNPETGEEMIFRSGQEKNSLFNNWILSVTGRDQKVYAGLENGGLHVFDIAKGVLSRHYMDIHDPGSLSANSIYALYAGHDGTIWIGAFSGGINYFNEYNDRFRRYKPQRGGLNNPYVLCVSEGRNGKLWIGTDGGGLNVLDRASGEFRYFQYNETDSGSLTANEITAVLEDSKGIIWVGTYMGGVCRLDPATGNIRSYRHSIDGYSGIQHDFIHTLFEDSRGCVYAGMLKGLSLYNPDADRFDEVNIGGGGNGVLSMIEDRNGNLWLGTYAGLCLIDQSRDTLVHYMDGLNNNGSMVPGIIRALYEDVKGRLWLGTTNGFYRFETDTGQPVRYQVSEDLQNVNITGIVGDDQGNLWATSSVGLLKIKNILNESERPEFIDFHVHDGDKALYESPSGEIFFGGSSGLYSFFPQDIRINDRPPDIVLTHFKIFNKEPVIGEEGSPLKSHISETREIVLRYDQSVITFEFAALNFIKPDKNQYAYMMEGFENRWNYVGAQRSATYTNLAPGHYTFRVKASNNDGVWNEDGVAVRIHIIPPWWMTSGFYWGCFFATAFIFISVWRFQMNKIRIKRKLYLEHLHAEKLEEMDRMKTRFFTNIAHELRTPLTLIMGPAQELLQSDIAAELKTKSAHILRNGKKLYQLVNELLDLARLENNQMSLNASQHDVSLLVEDAVKLFEPLAERNKISLIYDNAAPQNALMVYLDQTKFEKIIFNLLSNAIKFTPERGKVEISVKSACESHVEIIVSDNGSGFEEQELDKIFDRFYQIEPHPLGWKGSGIGLALTKELVELHGGTITVVSQPGKGSAFHVRFPLVKDHMKPDKITEGDPRRQNLSLPEVYEYQDGESVSGKNFIVEDAPIILVVDDHRELLDYLKTCLGKERQVVAAGDAEEGLELAFAKIPDLIISDVMMPGMDGRTFCKRLKEDERTSHIPVILLTARTESGDRIVGLENGADDYIAKPFDVEELEARIDNLIKQRRLLRTKFCREGGVRPEEIATTSYDQRFLSKAMEIIEHEMSNTEFGVDEFAEQMSLGRVQLYRKIRALSGQSTNEFIRTIRLNRAAQLLKQRHNNITQIAYEVGFNSQSYFTKAFTKHFGVSPSEFISKPQEK